MMLTIVLLALEGLIVALGAVGLGWWLHRRLAARWSTWAWGALAFLGSQAVRLPFLAALTVLLRQPPPDPTQAFWINLVILTVTAGLFEESARYVVLRWPAKDARRWRDAVMFGAGHGGIEALLLVGGSVAVSIVLLVAGETLLAQLQAASPEQAEALAAQLEALRAITWWQPLLAIWERVLAMTFHIAASILVVRAVRDRNAGWWALALLLHIVFNGVAVVALRSGGPVAAELALTAVSIVSVSVIVRFRPADAAT